MKRTTSLLSISAFVLLASFSAKRGSVIRISHTDTEELNLKGRIHSISEVLFNGGVKADKVFKTGNVPQKTDSAWFDDKGNKTDEKIYDAAGNILTEWANNYDANENLSEFKYSVKGKQRQKDTYKYDSLNRMVEWVRYKGADNLYEKDTYKYDENGHQNEQDVEEHYPVKRTFKKFYAFDEAGNKINEKEFTLGKGEMPIHNWKYDAAGNVTEETDYSPQGKLQTKILFTYNAGRLTERKATLPDGSIGSRDVYTYNGKGYKAVLDMYNNLGKLYHFFTYAYDPHGNIKEQKEFKVFTDEGNQLEDADTYELEYDKTGNWIKKTDLKLDGTVTLSEREIIYY